MSCALGDAFFAPEPDRLLLDGAERERLLDHAEECSSCRHELLAIDPTAGFARWRDRADSTAADEDFSPAEAEALAASVLTLRRTRDLEWSSRRGRHSRRWTAAAAALLVASVLLLPARVDQPSESETAVVSATTAELVMPAVEALDLPLARIYEIGERDFSVVMIVDESFDL